MHKKKGGRKVSQRNASESSRGTCEGGIAKEKWLMLDNKSLAIARRPSWQDALTRTQGGIASSPFKIFTHVCEGRIVKCYRGKTRDGS